MSTPKTTIAERKRSIRRQVREDLIALGPEARWIDPEQVVARILSKATSLGSLVVFAYLADDREIDLDPTIERLLSEGTTVAVPSVGSIPGSMTPVRLSGLEGLERDRYGLRVPPSPRRTIPSTRIDVALVPGVAFTTAGARLGRGGGYYDRLLATLPERVRRIGICHRMQIRETLPIEEHDASVDELLVRS